MNSLGQLSYTWFLATSLYDAIDDENIRQISTLIREKNANPNIVIPDYGVSPLHFAVGHNNERYGRKVTELLLKNGGDPNVPGDDGVTPLHVAAAWNKASVVTLLLKYNADPWIKDDNEKNAFHYAYEEKAWETIKALETHRRSKHLKCGVQDKDKYQIQLDKVIIQSNDVKAEYKAIYDSCCENKAKKSSVATQTLSPLTKSQANVTNGESEEFLSARDSLEYHTVDKYYDWCNRAVDLIITEESKRKIIYHRAKSCTYEYSPPKTYHCQVGFNPKIDKKSYFPPLCCISNKLSFNEVYHVKESPIIENSNVEEKLAHFVSSPKNKITIKDDELFSEDSLMADDQNSSRSSKYSNVLDTNDIPFIDETTSDSHIKSDASQKSETSDPKNLRNGDLEKELNADIEESGQKMKHVSWSGCLQTCVCNPKYNEDDTSIIYSPKTTDNVEESPCDTIENNDVNVKQKLNQDQKPKNTKDKVMKADISIEYKYVSDEDGIELIAAKMPFSKSNMNTETPGRSPEETDSSDFSNYDTDYVRKELKKLGFISGPISGSPTKKLYLRKLRRIRKTVSSPVMNLIKPAFSSELEQVLSADKHWVELLSKWSNLETQMRKHFLDFSFSSTWRSGTAKISFTYLLIDPRISENLPARCESMNLIDVWRTFVRSIFYIGKGTRARPYEHLHEALLVWHETQTCPGRYYNSKVSKILEIWREGLGVVCIQTFHNLIPAEAYTREAAMIDAIGLARLKNEKAGMYYGLVSTWSTKLKRQLGVYLLYRAMRLFIADNEVQLKPTDVN